MNERELAEETCKYVPGLEIGMCKHEAYALILDRLKVLEEENKLMVEVLEEVALPPYVDSNLTSLLSILQARANACLIKIKGNK